MTFSREGNLSTSYPTANPGANIKVLLPENSVQLSASLSEESQNKMMTYSWSQNYGPTTVVFSDNEAENTEVSNLLEGMYNFTLRATNSDQVYDEEELLVLVTNTENAVPTVALVTPLENAIFTEGDVVSISASAYDFEGEIQKVDFYQNDILIESDASEPYNILWTPEAGAFNLKAVATDAEGASGISALVGITVATLKSCTSLHSEATEGSFDLGYKVTYESVGTDVYISFEMLDDKVGLVAYLWNKSPFSEMQMENVSGRIFKTKIGGQVVGNTISYACKFAYAGGLSVTKYIDYVVGDSCELEEPVIDNDNFTIKTISESCEGLENGSLEITAKQQLNYEASIDGQTYSFTNSLVLTDLSPDTYNLCITTAQVQDLEQCFELEISAAYSLQAKSNTERNKAGYTTTVEIEQGTAPFKVYVNNNYIKSSSFTDINVDVQLEDIVKIKSSKDCEGVLETAASMDTELQVYPNPTNGLTKLFINETGKTVQVFLYSSVGGLIDSRNEMIKNSEILIDLRDKANGVYFIKVIGSSIATAKIIKQ